MKRGKFIVIEGGEGAGKTSVIQSLRESYLQKYFNIVWTHEPHDPDIRRVLLESKDFSAEEKMLLFYADRSRHLQTIIGPALESGANVVCDRFHASTYAYQVYVVKGLYEPNDFFDLLDSTIVTENFRPDHYFLLDVDPRIGLQRVRRRGERLTVFDQESLSYHDMVRRGLKHFLDTRALNRRTVVDASRPADIVLKEMEIGISKILGPHQ